MFLTPTKPTAPISLSRFVYLTIVGHAIAAIPFLVSAWITGVSVLAFGGYFLGIFLVLGVLLFATVSWLIAKGSNWTNTRMAAAFAVGHPMPFYVLLAAIVVIMQFRSGMPGWAITAILLTVAFGRMRLFPRYAALILRWLAPDLGSDPGRKPA